MTPFRFMLNYLQDIVEHGGLTLSAKQFVDNFFGHIFVIGWSSSSTFALVSAVVHLVNILHFHKGSLITNYSYCRKFFNINMYIIYICL